MRARLALLRQVKHNASWVGIARAVYEQLIRFLDAVGNRETYPVSFGHNSHTHYLPKIVAYPGDPPNGVTIGRYCSISADVEYYIGGLHRSDWISTFPLQLFLGGPQELGQGHPASDGPIVVGNDVWIFKSAGILSGVTIGDGAVVQTRSLVTRDVEPYTVVAGNPAVPVRKRFSDEHIDALLEIRWWDWPDEEIRRPEVIRILNGGSVEDLVRYAQARSSQQTVLKA